MEQPGVCGGASLVCPEAGEALAGADLAGVWVGVQAVEWAVALTLLA